MATPLPYRPADPELASNLSQLKILSICHSVWGALAILFSSVFIVHVILGIMMVNGRMNGATLAGPVGATTVPAVPNVPPPEFGWIFVGMGSCVVLFGWTLGVLNLYSARCLARQRRRTFSIVVAALNCLAFPLGTALGIFTLIVLLRESVNHIYDQVTAVPTAYWPAGTTPPPPPQ